MKKRLVSKLSILQVIKDYAANASIHGVGYIFSGKTYFEKFVWLVLVLTAVALASFLSCDVYVKWKENPVITSLKV